MAGGLPEQSLNGGLDHAYLRSHPVLSFHRRLRPPLQPARPDELGRQPRLSPYNIERTGENAYRITVAVSGFAKDELSIVAKENTLTIKGDKVANENSKSDVLYRGIAARAFERAFQLADFVQVKDASLENGLLHVDLVREIPKPRSRARSRSTPARRAHR